jgi:hypothetical protein
MFIVVSVYFVTDSVRKLLDKPSHFTVAATGLTGPLFVADGQSSCGEKLHRLFFGFISHLFRYPLITTKLTVAK